MKQILRYNIYALTMIGYSFLFCGSTKTQRVQKYYISFCISDKINIQEPKLESRSVDGNSVHSRHDSRAAQEDLTYMVEILNK